MEHSIKNYRTYLLGVVPRNCFAQLSAVARSCSSKRIKHFNKINVIFFSVIRAKDGKRSFEVTLSVCKDRIYAIFLKTESVM